MGESFAEQLAVAAAVWNSLKVVREAAEQAERDATKHYKEALNRESAAFQKFVELAEKATLEPVNAHG